MITLTPIDLYGSPISTACMPSGSLFISQRNAGSRSTSVLLLPNELDALLEDVKIAIALRDAE